MKAQQVPASRTVSIKNVNSGKFLDVSKANFTAGAHLIQYNGNGQSNQKFAMHYETATQFKINPMNGQKLTCGSNENGELALVAADKWAQTYTLVKKGDAYIIKSKDGNCLDVKGRATGNNAWVIFWTCKATDNANQKWVITDA